MFELQLYFIKKSLMVVREINRLSMTLARGIYKIPSIKHIFFITQSLDECISGQDMHDSKNKKNKEYFERIIQKKRHKYPTEDQQWIIKSICEDDFLSAIKQLSTTEKEQTNHSLYNSSEFEFLAININKSFESSIKSGMETRKDMRIVPADDLIEVFI